MWWGVGVGCSDVPWMKKGRKREKKMGDGVTETKKEEHREADGGGG